MRSNTIGSSRDVCEATVDRGAEIGERIVVAAVKDIAFDEFPESLDQIELRRIRRLDSRRILSVAAGFMISV